ncbi:MAG: sugar ABC transporter permease [Clostridiales bacterium]|jgi:raffinose/stachyose/melibiose transport system permease protein|nr:sugar ABC transporter permease [Clostridiales bacterium]
MRRPPSFEVKRKILGYVFLIPVAIMLGVFMFAPIVESVVKSFTNWSGMTGEYRFIGWDNYVRIFTDMPEYWRAMSVNARYAVIATTIQTTVGFFLSVLVINLTARWQTFFKVSLYLPVIIPAAAISVMWRYIYTPDYGLLNQLLRAVGLDSLTHAWTAEQATALGSVIFTNTWRYAGFTMVLYYVSMLDIPKEMLEASYIDGAGRWAQIRYFYFPLTRGATEINFILSITGCLRAFDIFYLLTAGGPGTHTKVVSMWIMETAFQSFKFGRALAMSIVLFLIVVMTMLVFRRILAQREES